MFWHLNDYLDTVSYSVPEPSLWTKNVAGRMALGVGDTAFA